MLFIGVETVKLFIPSEVLWFLQGTDGIFKYYLNELLASSVNHPAILSRSN
jgi:hypothetical protein